MAEKTRAFKKFDVVAGVATAGIAHGALVADVLDLPFIYVRSSAKAHGRQNRIEGRLEEGSRVLVIEDLISTGKSSIAACEAIQSAGAEVVGVLAIFSYGFDTAADVFTEKGIPMDTLSNYRTLVQEAGHLDYITREEAGILQEWNRDPAAWAEQFTQ